MRCIEILVFFFVRPCLYWLIETWDVLKYICSRTCSCPFLRLIETWDVLKFSGAGAYNAGVAINRNMRCIEINILLLVVLPFPPINRNMRCIEIHVSHNIIEQPCRINRNMRCIEMGIDANAAASEKRLIETWDVLKCKKGIYLRFGSSD